MIRVTCLGGAGTVTGSCFLLETPKGKKCLVDCGMFQGGKQLEEANFQPWGFDPKDITTLFLTHAHIDHSGRIPKLVKDGFHGSILTTRPTYELCEIMLLDSAHLQEMDALWKSKKNKRKGMVPVEPLYTKDDVYSSLPLFKIVNREQVIQVDEACFARLRNAGHILGASILEIWFGKERDKIKLVFSGDLGKKDQLIVEDPSEIFDANYLFLESTYGNRNHKSLEESKRELKDAIWYAVSHGEKVIVPAFAVERTQELLMILGEFKRKGEIPNIPVYLDSPLAIKATEVFRRNKEFYSTETLADLETGLDPFDMPNLFFTPTTKESMEINERPGSAIVIAGNGMCTGGRIRHHLKHNLWRKGASLVIVGYQALGTTGRQIVDGAKYVRIFGEKVAVAAKVFTIGGFSAHADQKELLDWVSHFESRPTVYIIHGEPANAQVLAAKIQELFGLRVHIPKLRERLILKSREETEVEEGSQAREPAHETIILNLLLDLEKEIKRFKKDIQEKRFPESFYEDTADRLEYLLEELKDISK